MKNPMCGHDMVIGIGALHGAYPGKLVAFCPNGGCAQWLIEFPVLDCLGCGKLFILNQMYSSDACSEQCQRAIESSTFILPSFD